jgi:hypothetical protein
MPADLTKIENRLRDAYADAAATVQQRDIGPYVPASSPAGTLAPKARRTRPMVPLAAAAAVLLVVIAAVTIPKALHSGSPRHGAAESPMTTPKYLATLAAVGPGQRLDIRSAKKGRVIATVAPPTPGAWTSVSAQSALTFVLTDLISHPASRSLAGCGHWITYLYRLRLSSDGVPLSLSRIAFGPVRGTIEAVSITPNGRRIGYAYSECSPGGPPGAQYLAISSLATGKRVASWTIPAPAFTLLNPVASLSIDDSGTAMSVGVSSVSHAGLSQATYVLRTSTSGRLLTSLRPLVQQDGAAVLAGNGKTLYEVAQAGKMSPYPWRERLVVFELTAFSTATGRVTAVLHTWRVPWSDTCAGAAGSCAALAIDPSGRYLIVIKGDGMAVADLATGRYRPLPGHIHFGRPHGIVMTLVLDLAW